VASPAIITFSDEGRRAPTIRVAQLTALTLSVLLIGNLGRVPVFSTGARDAPILFNDLAVGLLVAAGFVAAVSARSLKIDLVGATGLLFAAVGLASALLASQEFALSAGELIVSVAYLARWVFYFALYIVLINTLRESDVQPVWRALERVVLVFAGFGIVQSLFLPDFAQLVYPESRAYADWDPQGHRLVSTLLDPNFAGALIVMVLLVEIALLARGVPVPIWKAILLLAATLMTASRSSVLALLIGGSVIVVARGLSRRMLRFASLALVLLAISAPVLLEFARRYNKLQIDRSALGRITLWLRGLEVFADHPVLGVGFNTWGYVQERYGYTRLFASSYGLDGGLLFIAVMTGLVGLSLYVFMIGTVARRGRAIWRDERYDERERGLALGVVAATIAMCVHSLFTNSLLLPILMEVLWILWALVFAMKRRQA
jgi:O-antigen ligase